MNVNRLICGLREICGRHIFEEKWLIAPSRRVGFQWLDQVARSGVPVLNVRVKTMPHMALELASPEMVRIGATFLRGIRAQVLVDRIVGRMQKQGLGYFSTLNSSPRLIQAMCNSINDLRLAGLSPSDLEASAFEVEAKAEDLRTCLAEYEGELQRERLLDYADILRISADRLRACLSLVGGDVLVLLPEDMERDFHRMEHELWQSFPERGRRLIKVDRLGKRPEGDLTDLDLLRWIENPPEAPAPTGDGTARIFRAVGEVNEIREVFRRCVNEKIPFDEVEILHTDQSTYVSLVYEIASCLTPEADESIPVTFAEGIPPRYSRPARALMGWLEWIRDDYPQSTLVRMIQDGLIQVEQAGKQGFGFAILGATLRAVPIGNGREHYIEAIDAKLKGLKEQARDGQSRSEYGDEEEDDRPSRSAADLPQRIERLGVVRTLVSDIVSCVSGPGPSQKHLLEGALDFLRKHVRCVSQFDQYARKQLVEEIKELADCLEDETLSGMDVLKWLGSLCQTSHVGGQGPRPGCVYVAPILNGGHSGRKHTVIVGLEDSRFPGPGLQDPLLLDAERSKVSTDLPTARGRLARVIEDFARLLSRLRGTVTLSYSSRSLQDDREMFPSPVLLSAFRILSGNHEGDQNDLLKWLPDPASFAPKAPDRCVEATEWWLWRMCADEALKKSEKVIAENFTHLGRGLLARNARESDTFTEYDGYVPKSGTSLNRSQASALVVSASRLETLGSCPMEYFFKYILKIKPPEEYKIDPKIWLEPTQRGQLLHAVFREFMSKLRDKGLLPAFDRDWHLMEEILNEQVAAWKIQHPPPNMEVFEREKRDLHLAARIFLLEEERFCKGSRPFCFEAAVGLAPEGTGTILDTRDPGEILLGPNRILRARGRIDRVDKVPGTGGTGFAIWDYKTGSAWRFRKGRKRNRAGGREAPFDQGRLVQGTLYMALAEARLKEKVSPGARVQSFGYFFPNLREHGERIEWSSTELAEGEQVLFRLWEMIERGCYPFTDDADDVGLSDYFDVFGDVEATSQGITRKLGNSMNEALAPFQELRGYTRKNEK